MAELRELFAAAAIAQAKKEVTKAVAEVVKAGAKQTRKVAKSAWHKFIGQKKNQIRFKSGKRKGQLDLKRMAAAYRRQQKAKGRK